MITSVVYHTFNCRSETHFHRLLKYDLYGISFSLLAIYLSGIYYAFWCNVVSVIKVDYLILFQLLAALSNYLTYFYAEMVCVLFDNRWRIFWRCYGYTGIFGKRFSENWNFCAMGCLWNNSNDSLDVYDGRLE